ncbi:MAG: efflux RND transporter periplasmic adaptor subunit, partial [Nitrospiraceae bacterium]
VRNAPINIQNVVTYDVVVEFDNPNFRLKPGMTANVSIIVAQREGVLTVPNAALRFTPPVAGRASGSPADRIATGAERPPGKTARQLDALSRQVWTVTENDDPESMPVQVGISDGVRTEITSSNLKPGDPLIVGVESVRGERRSNDLPPGFGTGQQRSPRRDRAI